MELRPDIHRPDGADALLRHADFVRAVARSLLADEHLVEDVAQETWAIAFRRPPTSLATLRNWLATVARHTASRLVRTRSRQRRLEEDHAREAEVPSATESLARNELLRSVTTELLALREPYRETLLLRFYDGLTPRQIAERCGTSDKAIYSRLQRGMALLKERLDATYEGNRDSWCVALAYLLEGRRRDLRPLPWGAVPLGPSAAALLAIFLVVASCLVAAFFLLFPQGAASTQIVMASRAIVPGASSASGAGLSEPEGRSVVAAGEAPGEAPGVTAPIDPLGYEVRGLVRREDGGPVVGASVWMSESDKPWTNQIVASTDELGEFRLTDVVGDWRLGASAPGLGSSRLQDLVGAPGQRLSVRVDLPGTGGDLQVRVVDAKGAGVGGVEALWLPGEEVGLLPNLGILRTTAFGHHRADGTFLSGRVSMLERSDSEGHVRLRGLARGEGVLWLRRQGWAVLSRPLHIRPGEQRLNLTLSSGATLSGVVFDMYGDPVAGAQVDLGVSGDPDHQVAQADHEGRFLFAHVSAGGCALSAYREGIGFTTQRRLLPVADELAWDLRFEERFVTGRVVDEAGRALVGWTVRIAFDGPERFEGRMPFPPSRTDERGAFLLAACPGTSFFLNVDAGDGEFRVIRSIPAVLPGTDIEIVIPSAELPSAMIQGRIRDEAGGVAARLAAVRIGEDPSWLESSRYWAAARSDTNSGDFELGPVPPGRYALMIDCAGRALHWSEPFEVERAGADPGALVDLGTVWLEEPGRFRVTTFLGGRDDYENFVIHPKGDPSLFVHLGDGSFLEDVVLSPGDYSLSLVGFGFQGEHEFQVRSGELSLLELDRDIVRRQFEFAWPANPAVERITVLLYEGADLNPVSGWWIEREGMREFDVPLAVGDYVLEASTNTGVKLRFPVSAHRGLAPPKRRIILDG